MKAFCGKNIVLTGCNSGIGLSFLKLIAKDNKVLCVDVNVDRLREMATRFDGLTVLQGDVSTQEGVDRVFDEAEKTLKAVAKGKHICNPSALFSFFLQAVKFCPWLRTVYRKLETAKFRRYCKREQI